LVLTGGVVTILNSIFDNNNGLYGGAIEFVSETINPPVNITNSKFTNNNANAGGAIATS